MIGGKDKPRGLKKGKINEESKGRRIMTMMIRLHILVELLKASLWLAKELKVNVIIFIENI